MSVTKKILALLLCAVMVLGLCPTMTFAAGGATNVAFEVSATKVDVGDTFTVVLTNKEMTVTGFSAGFKFDNTLLECVSIDGPMAASNPSYAAYYYLTVKDAPAFAATVMATAVSSLDEANTNGTVGFAYIGTSDVTYAAGTLYTVTFKAKAAGEATFTLYEESNGTDAFKSDAIETKTTIITDPNASATPTWNKVVVAPADWSGTYLIVYEGTETVSAKIFDASRTTATDLAATNNYIDDITIVDGVITADAAGYAVTIEKAATDGYYTIKTAGGHYIGVTENKAGLNANKSTQYMNAIALVNGEVTITSEHGPKLCFNTDDLRFRYYASTGDAYAPVSLYKLVDTTCTHENMGLASDGEGKHNVVCTNCQTVTEADVACTGTDDGDCTTAVTCECGYVITAALSHVDEGKDHTCDNSGCTVAQGEHADSTDTDHLCDYCGLAVEGATCVGELTTGQAATCSADGWKDYYTCACGKLYSDAECTTEITLDAWKTGDGKLTATGEHSDAANDGDHKCDNCDYVYTNACAGGTATCTAKATCSECGQSYGELGDHVYGERIAATDAVHTQTELKGAVAAHYFCDVCDTYFTESKVATTLEALTDAAPVHTAPADDGDCTTAIYCSCGKVMTAANESHTGGTATCKEQAKCDICGTAYGELDSTNHKNTYLGTVFHAVGDGTHYQWRGCSDCQNAEIEKVTGSCADETTKDHKCDSCDYVMSTCSDGDDADELCDICGDDLHVCGNGTLTTGQAATCGADGWKDYYTCSCGKLYADEACTSSIILDDWKTGPGKIAATGHKWTVSGYTVTDDTHTANYVCGNDASHTKSDEAVTHTYDDKHTCVCGATNHTHDHYGHDATAHWSVCSCGATIGNAAVHTGGEATCQAAAVCGTCNATYGTTDTNNHASTEVTYKNVTDTTHDVYYACCDTLKTAGEAHTYGTTHKCACGAAETSYYVEMYFNGGQWDTYPTYTFYGFTFYKLEDGRWILSQWGNTANVITRTGYNFAGWTTVKDDASTKIDIDTWVPASGDIDLYALWECNHEGSDHTLTTTYTDKTADTHTKTVTCECGEVVSKTENVAHTYVNQTCACGVKLTGWDGNKYYVDGVMQTGWKQIGEDWYCFDATTGERATGLTRMPYPTVEINGVTYAPNAEDIAYAEKKGTDFIDEKEAWFYFDENGKFLSTKTGIEDGKYVENGMVAWHPGFVQVDGTWYYFVGDTANGGNKMANGLIYVTRNCDAAGFKTSDQVYFADGKVDTSKNGIVELDNVKYYFEDGKLACGKGLVEIEEGKYIYVRSSGALAMESYYLPAGLELASGLYSIDENGYIVEPKSSDVNGIVDGYYYKDGKVQYGAGLITLDGDIYYVRSNGQVATGKYYITNTNGMEGFAKGQKLFFGEDGKLEATRNGIVEENEALYYYVNNHVQYGAGLMKLEDGSYIYVRSNGQLATGKYYITTTNDLEGFVKGQKIIFGEDGKYIPEN